MPDERPTISLAGSPTEAAIVDGPPLSPPPDRLSRSRRWLADLRRLASLATPGVKVSLAFLALFALLAVLAPLILADDPNAKNLKVRLEPPFQSWQYPLGTDELGRDILTRIIYGARASFSIALSVVVLAGVAGTIVGIAAGASKGRLARALGSLIDFFAALPGLLIVLTLIAAVGPGRGVLIVALALDGWMVYARAVRGEVLTIKTSGFVEAATATGASMLRIVRRHLVRNVRPLVLALASLEVARILYVEAALSFIEAGVQPPAVSWGLMIGEGRNYIFNAWWLLVMPGLALALTILAVNVIANWARRVFDPLVAETVARGMVVGRRRSVAKAPPAPAEPASGQPLLEVRDLCLSIDKQDGPVEILRDISLTLQERETLAIVGESGSGKSMTALAITRLLPASARITSGSVRLRGEELLSLSEERLRAVRGQDIAMVFQDPLSNLNPLMTVGDQIAESIVLHTAAKRGAALQEAQRLLAAVHVPHAAERLKSYPHEFSGGMRQRVMLAIALARRPAVLVADEPTTALDVTLQDEILDLLFELKHQFDMAVLLITHDVGSVAGLADRVAVMYVGEVVEQGSCEEILLAPAHPYTRALLASVPRIDMARSQPLVAIEGGIPDPAARPDGCAFHPRCPVAIDVCARSSPRLLEIDPERSRRQAACWLTMRGESS